MEKLKQWLKQLFCRHHFVQVQSQFISSEVDSYVSGIMKCTKCGKVKQNRYYTGRGSL